MIQNDTFKSELEEFNRMNKWRQGHRLSNSQQERIAGEQESLLDRGAAIFKNTGRLFDNREDESIAPEPAAPIRSGITPNSTEMSTDSLMQPAINSTKQLGLLAPKASSIETNSNLSKLLKQLYNSGSVL
jgi:hypothetical protein